MTKPGRKRIAINCITFRDERHVRVLDSLDRDWFILSDQLEVQWVLVPNPPGGHPERELELLLDGAGVEGILLPGGGDIAATGQADSPDREFTEDRLISFAKRRNLPLLGVCRGAQKINASLGGKLSPIEGHVGVTHPIDCSEFFETGTSVNSFHNWGIRRKDLAQSLTPFATWTNPQTQEEWVEGFRHQKEAIFGIIWHPERNPKLEKQNLQFLKKVFKL